MEALLQRGVTTLFGLPGIQTDWLYNALYDAIHVEGADLRVIHTRHEAGAGYMALGYALATGGVGVFSVVPGPGFLNAAAALATAQSLGAKVLCLVGQLPTDAIGRGRGALHEVPGQLETLRSLTGWARRANSPAEIPALMAEAFARLHSGRPQPAGLELPTNVLAERAQLAPADAVPVYRPPLDEEGLEHLATGLASARAPMLFVGSGAQGVSAEVTRLAELLQAPVVAYRTGLGVLDSRHYLSLHQPAGKKVWPGADAVLAIGSTMRVPLQKWWRTHQPTLLRIDIDPLSHTKFVQPEVALTARAEDALPKLLDRLRAEPPRPSRRAELEAVKAQWREEVSVLEPQVTYLRVIREALGENGIFVDELTQIGFAARIAFPVYEPRSFLSTGYQGTLGWGFPAALGVKVARPELPVVSVTGDGGFMFGVQELATAVQHRIPLVTVLFNNNSYGNVKQMQQSVYGGRVIASDLYNPDFVALAEAFGALGLRAAGPAKLAKALKQGFEHPLPTLIEVPIGEVPSVDRFR